MAAPPPITTRQAAKRFGLNVEVFRRMMRRPGSPRPVLLHSQFYVWRVDELDQFFTARRARLATRKHRAY